MKEIKKYRASKKAQTIQKKYVVSKFEVISLAPSRSVCNFCGAVIKKIFWIKRVVNHWKLKA
jgi:hypothetical protein